MTPQDLKTLRLSLGWTIAQATDLTGLSAHRWERLEAGESKIPPAVALIMRTKAQKGTASTDLALTPAHLTAFRRAFSLTQALAAALADVSRVTWNRWEQGRVPVPAHLTDTLRTVVRELKALQEVKE